MRTVKDHLASWRHSADTATIERRSKVIDRRIHDARRAKKWRMRRARKQRYCSLVGVRRGGRRRFVPVPELCSAARTNDDNGPLPSFYPRGNLNNRHSSHSRRKMVCIARQGDLQGNPTVERVEGQFNEYRSGSGTGTERGQRRRPAPFRGCFRRWPPMIPSRVRCARARAA